MKYKYKSALVWKTQTAAFVEKIGQVQNIFFVNLFSPREIKKKKFDKALPCKRFLTELELFLKIWQELSQNWITHTAFHHIWNFLGSLHDRDPGLVNVLKTLCFLRQEKITYFLYFSKEGRAQHCNFQNVNKV